MAYLHTRNMPVKLTSTTSFQVASDMVSTVALGSSAAAALNTMSSRPNSATQAASASCTSASSVTSQ